MGRASRMKWAQRVFLYLRGTAGQQKRMEKFLGAPKFKRFLSEGVY